MKKKRILTVVILFILLTSSLSNGFAADFKFYYDVFSHWAVETIMWASNDVKLFKGYEDGTFRPDNQITIAEYTTLLYRTGKIHGLIYDYSAENANDVSNIYSSYSDLNQDFWAYNEITTVASYIDNQNIDLKFTDIFPGNELQPNRYITREEAVILSSFFTTPPISNDEASFEDIDADYKYIKLLSNLVNNKIIEGYEDNTFRPEQNITRAESATIFMRLYNDTKYLKKKYLDEIQLVNVPQYKRFYLYGHYHDITLTNDDNLYRRAVATLEYKSIIHYIPYEERHLYDSDPLETLWNLKDSGYWNSIGIDYYLITQGSKSDKKNNQLYLDMLENYITREDILDDESVKIFQLDYSNLDSLDELMAALEKWYNTTPNNDNKLNSLLLKSKIYRDKEDYLKALELYDNQGYFDLELLNKENSDTEGETSLDETTEGSGETTLNEENSNENSSPQVDENIENNKNDENDVEDSNKIVLSELNSESKMCYFMNKAYLLLLNEQYYDAEKTLRDGWSFMDSEEYDEEFTGAIKQVLMEIEKLEDIEIEEPQEDNQEQGQEESESNQ